MPTSGGASFHGGFEVVKRLWKMNLRPPVLMMTESLNQSLRLRARQMGVAVLRLQARPSASSTREQFEADLSAFAAKLVADVLPRLAEAAARAPARRRREEAPPPRARRGRRRRPAERRGAALRVPAAAARRSCARAATPTRSPSS